MGRREEILRYAPQGGRGIEIGPWFNPIAPKRDGYDCLVLDVFDGPTLRERAAADPNVPAEAVSRIEDVDLVGTSTHLDELVKERGLTGQFDYIVSSHNFEHLPNPIRFLRACEGALKRDAVLSMAIPDHRVCFDYFRPVTRLSEWIEAFFEDRDRPSLAQVYDSHDVFAYVAGEAGSSQNFHRGMQAQTAAAELRIEGAYRLWCDVRSRADVGYIDSHCSVFTPSSFELLVRDAAYLGLVPFEIIEVGDGGAEFYAHLRLQPDADRRRPAGYQQLRTELLHRIRDEEARASVAFQRAYSAESTTVSDMLASTSWRITAPLRRIATALRRGSTGRL